MEDDKVTAERSASSPAAMIVLGRRSIIDLPTIPIAAGTLLALVKLGRRAPEPQLAAAGLLGLAISRGRHPTPQPAAPPDRTTLSVGADVRATRSFGCCSPLVGPAVGR